MKSKSSSNIVSPTKEFIDTLKWLTDNNEHTEVNIRIADWCIANCIVRENWQEYMNIFRMFLNIFNEMKNCHNANGFFNFSELRFETSMWMEKVIVKCFGYETLEALTEGHR